MTSEKAIEITGLMIDSLPENLKHSNDFYFITTREIANALLRSINLLSGHPMSNKISFESGEEFKWRGIKFKVA